MKRKFLRALVFLILIQTKISLAADGSSDMIFTPVLGTGGNFAVATTSGTKSPSWMGTNLTFGGLVYFPALFENAYYRFGSLIDIRSIYLQTSSGEQQYAQMAVTFPAGVAYRVVEYLWPFIGVSVDWTPRDKCDRSGVDCGENKFSALTLPVQAGIAFGKSNRMKIEGVFSYHLIDVNSDIQSLKTFSVLIHLFPE